MKPNDKAIEALADVLQHHGVFHGWFPKGLPADWRQLDPIGRREFLDIAGRLADAAYAAQFQSEDYADIIRALRVMHGTVLEKTEKQFRDGVKETMPSKAADALEALLAERDALKSELIDYKDAAASEADFVNEQAEKIRELKAERDALLARLDFWISRR